MIDGVFKHKHKHNVNIRTSSRAQACLGALAWNGSQAYLSTGEYETRLCLFTSAGMSWRGRDCWEGDQGTYMKTHDTYLSDCVT